MKQNFSKRYHVGLQAYLKQRTGAHLQRAHGMGHRALTAGLQTLDIAKLHEQILVTKVLPGHPAGRRALLIKQAGTFFAEAIIPTEKMTPGLREAAVHVNQIVEMLSQRTVELARSEEH